MAPRLRVRLKKESVAERIAPRGETREGRWPKWAHPNPLVSRHGGICSMFKDFWLEYAVPSIGSVARPRSRLSNHVGAECSLSPSSRCTRKCSPTASLKEVRSDRKALSGGLFWIQLELHSARASLGVFAQSLAGNTVDAEQRWIVMLLSSVGVPGPACILGGAKSHLIRNYKLCFGGCWFGTSSLPTEPGSPVLPCYFVLKIPPWAFGCSD